jgi:hypothetical protein
MSPNWFRNFSDAVAEASFRAAVTKFKYKVYYDKYNKWWNLSETVHPIPGVLEGN